MVSGCTGGLPMSSHPHSTAVPDLGAADSGLARKADLGAADLAQRADAGTADAAASAIACDVQGALGTCVDINVAGACPGPTTPGYCPGPANIECCLAKAPPSGSNGAPTCDVNGMMGTCVDIDVPGSCSIATMPGYCPGPVNIQCCLGKAH
jgi:hypothetical protein